MFVLTVSQFVDVIAAIPTTHVPKAFFALFANVALVVYQVIKIRKHKLNPFKDEIYADAKAYQTVNAENA